MADTVQCENNATAKGPQTGHPNPRLIALVKVLAQDAAEARHAAETKRNETPPTKEEPT